MFFTTINDIKILETNFLQDLDDHVASTPDISNVTGVLDRNASLFKIYGQVLGKYDAVMANIVDARTQTTFIDYLNDAKDTLNKSKKRNPLWDRTSNWTKAAVWQYRTELELVDPDRARLEVPGPHGTQSLLTLQTTLCEIFTHLESLLNTVNMLMMSAKLPH